MMGNHPHPQPQLNRYLRLLLAIGLGGALLFISELDSTSSSHRGRLLSLDEAQDEEATAEAQQQVLPQDNDEMTWHLLKNNMCPNMTPNPKVWSTLFELAREEMGIAKDHVLENPLETFTKQFFTWCSGGVGYSSLDEMNHMVYLRVWKAGNNLVRLNLDATLKNKGKDMWDGDGRHLETFEKGWPTLWSPIPSSQLNNTCVVTAVRDPISHFLSGYNEMEYRVANGRIGYTWEDPHNPNKPNTNNFHRLDHGTTARFEQFVTDFISGAAYSPGRSYFNIYHAYSMTGVLWELKRQRDRTGEDLPRLTAYLPSISDLDKTFPEFLGRNCEGLPQEATENPWTVNGDHPSQKDGFGFYSAAKEVWGRQDSVSRALCALHALDYACFDDIPVPSLCESVYSSQRFRKRMVEALAS